MLDNVRETLRRQCQIVPSETVVVGVSGGPDSLCLLDVLHRLEVPVVVAHLNHGLRPDAVTDALRVQEFAESCGLPFALGEQDVAGYAESQGLSVEESARKLRYRFLFAKAEEYGAQAVAVGHTADDQVETVLMHLLRGAGLSGLKGMQVRSLPNAWSKDIPLIRPLLDVWREDILGYLSDQELKPLMDRTNLDVTLFRNRLRHELIPYLESYNPAVSQIVWRMAEVLSADYEVLEKVIDEAWRACLIDQASGYVALDFEEVRRKSLGLQRQIFRRSIAGLRPGLRDIDFESVERGLEFLNNPPSTKQIDLIAGLRLLLEGDRLYVATWETDLPVPLWPQLPDGSERELPVPGELALRGVWRLKASVIGEVENAQAQAHANTNPYQAFLDMDKLSDPLKVRARRPGDRFQPLGMEGHSLKLADFMVNVKLPRRVRSYWPVVWAGDEIVWVSGLRLSHPFRLTEDTRRVVRLSLLR